MPYSPKRFIKRKIFKIYRKLSENNNKATMNQKESKNSDKKQ